MDGVRPCAGVFFLVNEPRELRIIIIYRTMTWFVCWFLFSFLYFFISSSSFFLSLSIRQLGHRFRWCIQSTWPCRPNRRSNIWPPWWRWSMRTRFCWRVYSISSVATSWRPTTAMRWDWPNLCQQYRARCHAQIRRVHHSSPYCLMASGPSRPPNRRTCPTKCHRTSWASPEITNNQTRKKHVNIVLLSSHTWQQAGKQAGRHDRLVTGK